MVRPLVIFRVDASIEIGTGHVMRCLALADVLRKRGGRCRFICRSHPGRLCEQIRLAGHDVHELYPDGTLNALNASQRDRQPIHAGWLGVDWKTDVEQTLEAIGSEVVEWVIVDHYALDFRWERSIRAACRQVMVIDDLVDRSHDCELLLNQTLGRTALDYCDFVPSGCQILCGPEYALLRPEFAALRSSSLARRATPNLQRVLVTMGGVDKGNVTCAVLDALRQSTLPVDCSITVVMGLHAPWIAEVCERAESMPWATEVLVNVHDMGRLMAESDLAIGSAGGTSWERCCVGLPALIIVLAENQREAALALAAHGAGGVVENGDFLVSGLLRWLEKFNNNHLLLKAMSDGAKVICDGQGAPVVARRLVA